MTISCILPPVSKILEDPTPLNSSKPTSVAAGFTASEYVLRLKEPPRPYANHQSGEAIIVSAALDLPKAGLSPFVA